MIQRIQDTLIQILYIGQLGRIQEHREDPAVHCLIRPIQIMLQQKLQRFCDLLIRRQMPVRDKGFIFPVILSLVHRLTP